MTEGTAASPPALAGVLYRTAPAARMALVGATLIDGTGAPPMRDAAVLVSGRRIERVVSARDVSQVPPAYERIDVEGRYLMPSLIDCHVHLTGDVTNDPSKRYLEGFPAVRAIRAVVHAQRVLAAGFTTVRHLGHGRPAHAEAAKRAIRDGAALGPRILTSGWAISQTGGHGDLRSWPYELVAEQRPRSAFADGARACRELVRENVASGAEWIKIYGSEGLIYTPDRLSEIPNFTESELAAFVDEAHRLGARVSAHTTGTEATRRVVRAGVDTVEHGPYESAPDVVDLMVRHGTVLVPTLSIYEWTAREGHRAGYAPWVLERSARRLEGRRSFVRDAVGAGVTIALGTDSGGPPRGGANAAELTALVAAGLRPMDALVAGTSGSARALGIADIGSVLAGSFADLLILSSDPLADLASIGRPGGIERIVQSSWTA